MTFWKTVGACMIAGLLNALVIYFAAIVIGVYIALTHNPLH